MPAMPTAKPADDDLTDRAFTRPGDGDEGIGPTLGQDVGADEQRREDARHGARDIADDEED